MSLLLSLAATMQAQVVHRQCGAMETLDRMIQDNPAIAVTRRGIEEQTARFVADRSKSASRSTISIPVVVHVLYSAATQNISDAQILSQIAILNADFGNANANRLATPSTFQALSANTGLQFCLAQRDPNGNATTGIVRRPTTVSMFTTSNAAKYTAQGGDDAWPAASYLNLWVCDLGSGLLGYSQFPGGAAATDGVVINYTAFGNVGTAAAPYDLGRTATHEIGHWLNLYHIWGSDMGACTGTDYVDDTPNQAGENFGCPIYPHISCTNGPTGDMYMNYMDYTDDVCMSMFSGGQGLRMQSLFAPGGARASILSSQGCVPPGGSVACAVPSALTTGLVSSPTDTILWTGVSGATSYILEYKPASASAWASATATTSGKYLTGLSPGTTYSYHVSAVCYTGISAASAERTFTTTSVANCTDVYEPNESQSNPMSIPVNTDITAMIGTATDKDYFRFANSADAPHIRVSLTSLPADYDLRLYDAEGTLLFTSQNNNTTNEYIRYNNAAVGAYYISVSGSAGAYSATDCYTLQAAVSADTLSEISPSTGLSDLQAEVQYNVYPNPNKGKFQLMIATSEMLPRVTLRITDMLGKTVHTDEYEHVEGMYSFEVSVPQAAPGMYTVIISDGTRTETRLISIQR